MSDAKVIRLVSDVALAPWPDFPPEALETGSLPSGGAGQNGHYVFEEPSIGLSAGVWDGTACTAKMEPYPVTEFMLLLEGSVTMTEPDGKRTTMTAGESFIVPKGTICQWHQPGYVRKFFVILDDAKTPLASGATRRIIKLDHARVPDELTASPPADLLISGQPQQHNFTYFEDASGQLTIGLWDTTAYHRKNVPFPRYELMHFLEGEVSTTDAAGRKEHFRAGDTLFIPFGTKADFNVTSDYLRKIYVIFSKAGG